jgi:hypothetical protein
VPINEEDMVVMTNQRFLVVDRARFTVKHQAVWGDVESVRAEPVRAPGSSSIAYVQVLCRGVGRVDLPADMVLARVLVEAMERVRHDMSFTQGRVAL